MYSFIGGDVVCILEDVLIFISEANQIPLLGFGKTPSILFHEAVLATASTCDCNYVFQRFMYNITVLS